MRRLFAEKLDALDDPLDPGFGFDLIRLAATRTVETTPAQRGRERSRISILPGVSVGPATPSRGR